MSVGWVEPFAKPIVECRAMMGFAKSSTHPTGARTRRMELDLLLQGLEATSVATAIRENEVLFPWIESIHVLAIALVV
jgi:hypothetical protein